MRKLTFTHGEYNELRILISKKVLADINEQQKLHKSIRKIGFYFSDFSSKKGYGISDLEDLVRTEQIKINIGLPSLLRDTVSTELYDEISITFFRDVGSVWLKYLKGQKILETERDIQKVDIEGPLNQDLNTKYELNPFVRKICIDYYGPTCSVCEFNFENEYGDLGKGFTHLHHLKQVDEIGIDYKIDPVKDYRPICPNCHVMIHRRKIPYTIEELKEKMNKNKRL